MKKTIPKEEYGYYCDLCGRFVCKYLAEYNGNFIYVQVGNDLVDKDICNDCARLVAEGVLDEF